MSHTLFISDLHLSKERPITLAAFLNFLDQQAPLASTLYILGDLFDVWLGDDDDSDLANQVRHGLKKLSKNTPVYFQHGNRDFLLGEQFARDSNISLTGEETVITLGNKNILLMHGDLLCSDDLAYLQARLYLRTPAVIQDFLKKLLQERAQIAADYRQQSGEATSMKASDIMDVNQQTVADYMSKHQVNTLIHGHTHRPAFHDFMLNQKPARRLVLTDWHDSGTRILALDNHTSEPRLLDI